MKDLLPALRKIMLDYPPIVAAVGSASQQRIYPVMMPQGMNAPSIVQNLISEVDDYHLQGPSGLSRARVQIDCWAQTDDEAVALAGDVHDALSGFRGTVSYGTPVKQVTIRGIFVDMGGEQYDSVAKLYSRRRDFIVWHLES